MKFSTEEVTTVLNESDIENNTEHNLFQNEENESTDIGESLELENSTEGNFFQSEENGGADMEESIALDGDIAFHQTRLVVFNKSYQECYDRSTRPNNNLNNLTDIDLSLSIEHGNDNDEDEELYISYDIISNEVNEILSNEDKQNIIDNTDKTEIHSASDDDSFNFTKLLMILRSLFTLSKQQSNSCKQTIETTEEDGDSSKEIPDNSITEKDSPSIAKKFPELMKFQKYFNTWLKNFAKMHCFHVNEENWGMELVNMVGDEMLDFEILKKNDAWNATLQLFKVY